MSLTEFFLIILCIQISNIFMFVFFMFVINGRKVRINPIQLYREHKEIEEESEKEKLKEKQILESIENIDNYNGTEFGQKEITRYL